MRTCVQGVTPVLPIFREGLLSGGNDLKEAAAAGLGEVIRRTSDAALKPSVVNITGPLIRVLGDRFQASVKVAVLDTLALLLQKVSVTGVRSRSYTSERLCLALLCEDSG